MLSMTSAGVFQGTTVTLQRRAFRLRTMFSFMPQSTATTVYLWLGVREYQHLRQLTRETASWGTGVALIISSARLAGMELPNYRLPSAKSVGMLLWDKAKDFLQRAFSIIFIATVIIWFLQTFDTRLNVVSNSSASLLALIGRFISPVFAPLGFADWRITTALISGFTAKEAVVSTLTVLLDTGMSQLPAALSGLFTPLSAVSFLVFTLLYTPCVAAIAAVKRELGSGAKAAGVALMQCCVA